MIKEEIRKLLQDALAGLQIAVETISIDYSVDVNHGDYATNVALVAAKKAGKNPMELAEAIAEKVRNEEGEVGMFEKIEIAKPGFINFWVRDEALLKDVAENHIPQMGKGKKVIVEYSSPNIAKPFTIGHLRSTIIGDAIANLLAEVGFEVFRDNHIGDWGTQFGKQIYAIKEWGKIDEIEKSERPVKELVALYVRFHEEAEKDPSLEDKAREWFKKLEDGDLEARRLWKKCIEWSWKEFDAIYKQLQVSFTENGGRGYGEAFFEDKMSAIIEELKQKDLLSEGKEGAKIVEFSQDTKLPPLMILKKDGATLYSTRDLATDRFRLFEHEAYGRDVLIINEVGIEQSLYFQQLYKPEAMLEWVKPGQRVHVKHGHYRFKEGKMSTRKGNVIWLEDVLEEARHRAKDLSGHNVTYEDSEDKTATLASSINRKKGNAANNYLLAPLEIEKNAEIIAMGALKWNDLKRDSKQDINFDWDEILNMQGNSGPYLQYTYVRTKSVLEKAGLKDKKNIDFTQSKMSLAAEERDILHILAHFPEIVEEAALRYAPHVLATYLFELAQAFNLFYQKLPILKADNETRDLRLQLTEKTGTVLQQGLYLLGIQTPEKM
jgi:arginyl-tRNA synthetase